MRQLFFSCFLLFALFCTGCGDVDYRPGAIGKEGQVTVVIDSSLWEGIVGTVLEEAISQPIVTLPSWEPLFEIDPVHLTDPRTLDDVKSRKNILFVGAVGDTLTNEARVMRSMLSEEALEAVLDGGTAAIARRDMWRKRQQVFFVVAASTERLVEVIRTEAENIVYQLNEITRTRTHRDMFDMGRQPDLEQYLMNKHGFAVHGQHDYVVATDTANFVWLRRVLSDTWRSLFVYYVENIDATQLSAENIIQTRNSLTRQFVQGSLGGWVEIDELRPLQVDSIDFKGRFTYEIRGLWHMVGEENGEKFPFGQGGPFLTYAFYDEPSQRLYIIDGMILAPGYPKREFLRQMEVIAYTFRTRQEVVTET